MFTRMRSELKELLELTTKIASDSATLWANHDIVPDESYWIQHRKDEARRCFLLNKYELR